MENTSNHKDKADAVRQLCLGQVALHSKFLSDQDLSAIYDSIVQACCQQVLKQSRSFTDEEQVRVCHVVANSLQNMYTNILTDH